MVNVNKMVSHTDARVARHQIAGCWFVKRCGCTGNFIIWVCFNIKFKIRHESLVFMVLFFLMNIHMYINFPLKSLRELYEYRMNIAFVLLYVIESISLLFTKLKIFLEFRSSVLRYLWKLSFEPLVIEKLSAQAQYAFIHCMHICIICIYAHINELNN